MKQLQSLFLVALLMASGCATWQDNAGKSLATIAQTVDAAMKSWAIYVNQYPVSDEAQAKVKKTYEQYQSAMAIALSAYNTSVALKDESLYAQASATLTNSKDALLALIKSFQTP